MATPTSTRLAHVRQRRARVVVAVVIAVVLPLIGPGPAGGAGPADGVEVALRDDPRPAADVPGAFEPPPGRRAARRSRRRSRQAAPQPDVRPAPASSQPPRTEAAADIRTAAVAHRGQRYGAEGHPRQRFDLHLPEGCAGGSVPLVVWIRGTDWRGGQQEDCPLLWLVREGFAVASVDYRPSDVALFPAQLDDCRAAVAALRRDAELWGIDPERICVLGRAAGGHLAALVAFAAPEPAAAGDGVAAVVAIGAPSHLASLGNAQQRGTSAAARLVGGPLAEFREAARKASPLEHVSADAPPTLILHGARDANVPAEQSLQLDRALKAAGADSTLVMLDDEGAALDAGSVSGRAVRRFLDRVLGPGPGDGTAH